jgi:hypothetical protein
MTLSTDTGCGFALSDKHFVSFSKRNFMGYLWTWNGAGYDLRQSEFFNFEKYKTTSHTSVITNGIVDKWNSFSLFLVLNEKKLIYFKLDLINFEETVRIQMS